MKASIVVALLAVVCTNSAASAFQLEGSFLAREAVLKKNLVASDMVTATLYSDSACTTDVVATQTSALEDLVIDRISPLKLKDVLVKPVKGARLHFVFDAPTPASIDSYLKVTSGVSGAIVGIPSDCQPQPFAGCLRNDLACTSNEQCCSNVCRSGNCLNGACQRTGTLCSAHNQCCSSNCSGSVCQ